MTRSIPSRRAFLKTSTALMGVSPLATLMPRTPLPDTHGPLMAYVATFSSPLRDTLPTQVDLPPGNGRGIHIFQVNRSTGALRPAGAYESGTSPNCIAVNAAGTRMYATNETASVGENKEGTLSAFAINRT